MAKLGELGKIITGNTPKTSDAQNYESNDICFVKPSDFTDNEITEIHQSEFYISAYAKDKARVLPTDSILVTCIGIIGKVAINKVPCAFNQQINAIIPERKICDPRYVAYAIQNVQPQMQNTANAAVVPILNKTRFSNIEIPLPSLETQKQIVEFLDKVTSLISLRKQQLAKLDELVKARFVEMFGDPDQNPKGWPLVSITEIIRDKASNGFFAKRDAYKDDGNVQILGVSNVVNRMYSNTKELPRTNATQAEKEKYSVKYGDMLFCRSSLVADGIGKASIVAKGTFPNVLFECHVIRLSLDLQKCVPEFVQVLSTTPFFRRQIIAQSKTATMTTIGQDGILKSSVVLPPIDLQNQFAAFVERVDQQKQTVQQSLEKLELMKKALMQEYFG
jgi:type I restriction enzyme, S subunit